MKTRVGMDSTVSAPCSPRLPPTLTGISKRPIPSCNSPSPTTNRHPKRSEERPARESDIFCNWAKGGAFNLQTPGRYRIKIQVSGLPAFTGRAPRLSLWHHQRKKSFAGVDLATTADKPETIELEGLFPAGNYRIRNHARTQQHPNGAYKLFRNEQIDASQPCHPTKVDSTLLARSWSTNRAVR